MSLPRNFFGQSALILLSAGGLALAGCGTPSAPLPPSLYLPEKVGDLSAVRAGGSVTLRWTMPRRTTDKLLLKDPLTVLLCRREGNSNCVPTGPSQMMTPATAQSFTEELPPALVQGHPRALSYSVEVRNQNGRTMGPSNAAVVVAGAAPDPVTGLAAELRKTGVALRWNPAASSETVRLERKLVQAAPKRKEGPLSAEAEPAMQNLLVEHAAQPGVALDKGIRFGQVYEYRAQRLARVSVDGKTYELASSLSAPLRVAAADIFPPAAPAGLVAVATLEAGASAAIDLSWQPVEDADLAGYAVYRLEGAAGWQRISADDQVVGPSFRDRRVEPGRTYKYAIRSVGRNGHESARSAEAEETVPER